MHIRKYLAAVICIVSVFSSGCFERKEEITLSENGDTFIRTLFEGDTEQYPPIFELPNDGPWEITDRDIKNNKDGSISLKIEAEMTIPYGETLPGHYNLDDRSGLGLRFPSTVKTYKEGKRTFYEFTRRYQSRKYAPYEILYERIDGKLEEKIFENGIFNVPEKDQIQYLNQLVPAFRLSQLRYIYDALGRMVLHNDISQDLRKKMIESARDEISANFTPDRLKQILARIDDDKTLAKEMDSITREVDQIFISVFKKQTQPMEQELLTEFTRLLKNERDTRAVTDALSGHGFQITLKMPGQIVATNGIFNGESLGTITWEFSASALNDCEYVLHAVSVTDE